MTKPPHAKPATAFDLASIDRDLRLEEAYVRTGHTARMLVRDPDLRVVLVVMKAGSRISEHRAEETATIHVLAGHLRLGLPSGGVELSAGQLLVLERAVPHDVEAVTETRFLLTLAWKKHP
jgi:quercetin dioxygenase-like cupin family protein